MPNRAENPLYYVRETFTQDTGSGFMCDVFLLNDGTVLVVGEDSIVLYENADAWENDPSHQDGFIIRPNSKTS